MDLWNLLKLPPESWDHLCEADDFLDAVGHQVGQVGQHGELGVLLARVRTVDSILVHHQQAAEVHLCVHRLCFMTAFEAKSDDCPKKIFSLKL